MTDNKNTILAIVLSALVLIGWQYFCAIPQEKAKQEQLQAQQQAQKQSPQQPAQVGQPANIPGRSTVGFDVQKLQQSSVVDRLTKMRQDHSGAGGQAITITLLALMRH